LLPIVTGLNSVLVITGVYYSTALHFTETMERRSPLEDGENYCTEAYLPLPPLST